MQFSHIISYYKQNALFQKHDYPEKFNNLAYFNHYTHITYDVIIEYAQFRSLLVKNSTINRELNIARAAINFWNKHNDDNVHNPFNGFNLFEQDFLPRFLSESETSQLLNATKCYSNPILYHYVFLLLSTGCRSKELLTLTWDRIFFDDGYFIIINSLSKNKKTVYKPLTSKTIQSLKSLKHHHKWVFYNPKTNNSYKTFRRGFQWSLQFSNLGKLRIHDLRHTFASFLVKKGVPIYHVSQLLGHSDTRITQRYAHLSPDNLSSVLKNLPDF